VTGFTREAIEQGEGIGLPGTVAGKQAMYVFFCIAILSRSVRDIYLVWYADSEDSDDSRDSEEQRFSSQSSESLESLESSLENQYSMIHSAKEGIKQGNYYYPSLSTPFRLSRSKIELFLRCPRCFYLDRRAGIGPPSGPSYNLNLAVDLLLKREFDAYRLRREPHPLMTTFSVEAIPFDHPDLPEWRDSFRGITYLHSATNFIVFGAVDDLWIGNDGRLLVVDYKATSSERSVSMDGKHSYKRQVEIYQWLLRKKGFSVSDIAYFVYVNVDRQQPSFEDSLRFTTTILPHIGNDAWVDDALGEAKLSLDRELPPLSAPGCEWCEYREKAREIEK
jgi:CRISPR/Cas system-associated exonuclease Cas4 (RecB family)